ncbi:protein Shroom isoform X1 [Drosophila nasuta]|uniref:protein Shroom isoform X1 n=1 Tax=Drosophila nasuta TaxID=42062 RepID=UPI00295E9028|nr:protein Shroom isoform X1 [Drosophila nasuta]
MATKATKNNNNNININININNGNGQTDKLSVSKMLLPALKSASKDATIQTSQQQQQQQRRQQQFTPLSVSDAASNASFSSASVAGSIQDDMPQPPTQPHSQQQQQQLQQQQQQQQSLQHLDQCGLTQAGLEEYNIRASSYYDQTTFHHQKQHSYAQSEGYHSYVSSSDSTSATPFLDKLRQESDLLSRQSHHWSENDLSSVCSNSVAPSPIPLLARQCSSRSSSGGNISGGGGNNSLGQHHHSNANSNNNHSPNSNNINHNSNNNNNSSESTSSTETLKWLGSMSDISEASHATGYSAIAESVSSSQLIVHSSRVLTPKRHQSESVLYLHDNEVTPTSTQSQQQQQPPQLAGTAGTSSGSSTSINSVKQSPPISEDVVQPLRVQHRHSPSYPPVHQSMALHRFQQQHQHQPANYKLTAQSSLPELESPPPPSSSAMHESRSLLGQSHSTGDLQQHQQSKQLQRPAQKHKSSISVTISSSEAVVTIAPQPPPSKPQLSKLELLSCSAPNVASSGVEQSPPLPSDSYRSNHRLFPVSTYTEPVHSNTSQYVQHPKPQYCANLHKSAKLPVITPAGSAVQPAWHSVAERINDFERSQMVEGPKFAYLEPSKTHRLSNPALKAFQKNAVQSYVERQQQQAHKEEQQLLRPQTHSSYQALPVERKSLPNNMTPMMIGIPSSVGSGSSGSISPTPPPPPPRSRSLLPNLLRRSSSASDYAEFREQHSSKPPSIRNIGSAEKMSFNDCGMPPPPPPPRGRGSMPARRTSSATEYAPTREKLLLQQAAALAHQQHHPQQHRHAGAHLHGHAHAHGHAHGYAERPPERPPKHPHLRVPSPELPPPPLGGELDTSYTFDEPLPPPPPPELLQPRPPPSPNRRNSFAGASTRRSAAYAVAATPTPTSLAPKVPPQVPKKPTSLRQQHQQQQQQLPHKPQLSNGAVKPTNLPTSRKRPHNTPPILESVATATAIPSSATSNVTATASATSSAAPPPLLPRARPTHADSVIASNLESNQQKRSNSKASYLPRQSLEKLNNTDPDHGIYKLTLTSNEDLVAPSKPIYGVGAGKLKLPNNLPDVLPLGVKLQQQPAKPQPSSPGDGVSLRYGSNNNLATKSPTNATPNAVGNAGNNTAYAMIYGQQPQQQQQQLPPQSRYSSPALGHAYSRSPAPQFTRSQSYEVKQQQSDPTQFMSQSHVDLKQAVHDLETTLEEVLPPPTPTPPRLSPATSDCSLSNSSLECSPLNANHTHNHNNNPEAHIFRAELISTTTSATLPKPPPVNRQESLRENIEKITQLQSQLMSAHLCDSGLLSNYAKQLSPSIEPQNTELPQLPAASPTPSSQVQTELTPPLEPTESAPASPLAAESLQLLQRSELVLMVNPVPSTADMACQTEELLDSELVATREEQQTRTTLQPRQRQAIELEYEQMALELLKQLAPHDKLLIEILTPKSYKPTTQYVSNLYNPDVPLRPAKRDVGTSTLMRMKASATAGATTELQLVSVELQLTDDTGAGDDEECTNLIKQKLNELIKQLNQKIGALKREQQTIGEECATNDKLGLDLLANLTEKVRPSEASKFRTYIDDVGQITRLLLSLSERLAQTECSLEARSLISSQQEKSTLEAKRERLYEQLEEAQRLKADIDRRGSSIAKLFGKHLSADMCADYDYFINMKAKLIADARDLADRIKGSEEQLSSLSDALVQSDC